MRRDDVLAILGAHRDELRRHRVRSLALFGSTARDQARAESDVDFLVELERPAGYFTLFALQHYLEDLLGRPVDLVPRDALRPDVRDQALGEAIEVA